MVAGSHPPAVTVVDLPGLERAALATYGGFATVTFEGRRSAAATGAARAYEVFLAGLDAELAQLWEEIPPPRLLAVSSPYGVAAPRPALRPLLTSDFELRGSVTGDSDGLLLMFGDDLRAGFQAPEGRILDVAPTLLYAVALPIARDFDGRVLAEMFEPALLQRRALSFVASYEGLRR